MKDNSYQKKSESDATYNGKKIQQSLQRLTQEDKMKLLNTHPLFTGRCPCCEIPLKVEKPEWHCHQCSAQSSGTARDEKEV